MRRFLVLYTDAFSGRHHYAEGLIHYDQTVYLRGFYPEEGKPFSSIRDMETSLKENDGIESVHIQMIDEETQK